MIVVTGATGNVGQHVVRLLSRQGEDVVAVSRRPRIEGLGAGARHVRADVGDAASMRPALTGADALFLLIGGELNSHGEPPAAVIDAAVQSGVKRIVLQSSQVSATRPDVDSHARLREFEAAVRASGVDVTILRPSGFASNAFGWAESVRTARTVFAPFGDVGLPVVDPADIAAVAATALTQAGHAERVYDVTGPHLITPREQAAVIADVVGVDITFVELTREQARAHLAQVMPEAVIDGTLDVLGLPLPTERRVSPDVASVLGHPARPFAEWVTRNRLAFA
ncbi:NAD(P)H-binding protein [Gordonia sp. TBRC 11910]|uniref:NAD(P)H-binding protein n=1 Tax=Gordonia asplenii TaxID=2725283 RepID=A0A848L6M3_9ACTN|nr:NAD(P)H-binding protein [Gordonia asplenii]NMO03258.1 NAD(P)H-binding protein [Gordonia asplenii]